MHLRVLALGHRQPDWVRKASQTYSERLPKSWRFGVTELDPGKGAKATPDQQGERLLAKLKNNEALIALDERGKSCSSKELAATLEQWQGQGNDIVFAIGGADGLSEAVKNHALQLYSLSAMTLPHGLARVVLIEQLYRAHSLISGHPYHRD